jgi:hypothetical protein
VCPTIEPLVRVRLAGVLDARHAEVGQLDAPAGLDQQVGRLDVAVHDVLAVRIVQRRQQVAHDAQRTVPAYTFSAVQVLLEVVALDIFHDQVGGIAVALGVVDADDVGMLQRAAERASVRKRAS